MDYSSIKTISFQINRLFKFNNIPIHEWVDFPATNQSNVVSKVPVLNIEGLTKVIEQAIDSSKFKNMIILYNIPDKVIGNTVWVVIERFNDTMVSTKAAMDTLVDDISAFLKKIIGTKNMITTENGNVILLKYDDINISVIHIDTAFTH